MAVEARHLRLFPPQILPGRMTIDGMKMQGDGGNSTYDGGGGGRPAVYGPLSGTTTTTDNTASLIPPPPMYGTAADSIAVKAAMKSDSGLTCSIPVPRKRSRDDANQPLPLSFAFPQNSNQDGSFTFLGQDISSLEIQQQQYEIDRFIAQQTAKMKMEMEERRKSHSRRIITAVEETVRKKLRAKEEEIEKIGRLNWVLEEKVKSLCVENQIWRELAQSNEATANALRNNLEQVLLAQQQVTHLAGDHQNNQNDPTAAWLDDAQSCCGSNNSNPIEENDIINGGGSTSNSAPQDGIEMGGGGRWCRNCWKEEASVLLLPCRHLCACGGCGPFLHTCPVCLCSKNGTLHVNLSTSS